MRCNNIIATIALSTGAAVVGIYLLARRRRRQEIFIKFKTMQGNLLIYTIEREDGKLVRVMDSQGAYESSTYVDDELCYELDFDYHRAYNHVFDASGTIRSMLMLGGGGFAYPKYIISHYEDIEMDVVEIDPMVVAIARRYFFLDRLEAEFDIEQTHRMRIIEDDGRKVLDCHQRTYDVIANDCFLGRQPVMALASVEAMQAVHDCLNPGGIYMSNVISAVQGEEATFLNSIVATLKQVFERVYVIACNPDNPTMRANNVVLACDEPHEFGNAFEAQVEPGATVFHDDLGQMYQQLFEVADV